MLARLTHWACASRLQPAWCHPTMLMCRCRPAPLSVPCAHRMTLWCWMCMLPRQGALSRACPARSRAALKPAPRCPTLPSRWHVLLTPAGWNVTEEWPVAAVHVSWAAEWAPLEPSVRHPREPHGHAAGGLTDRRLGPALSVLRPVGLRPCCHATVDLQFCIRMGHAVGISISPIGQPQLRPGLLAWRVPAFSC